MPDRRRASAWTGRGMALQAVQTELSRALAPRTALGELGELPLDELRDALLTRLGPRHGLDDVAHVAVRAHPEHRPRPPGAGPDRLPEGVD